jgi:hypothetical protein
MRHFEEDRHGNAHHTTIKLRWQGLNDPFVD